MPNARSNDTRVLFLTRAVRLFAYGLVSVVLVLFLAAGGIGDRRIGLLLSLTLVGDTLISLYLTTRADRIGRKRTLLLSALLLVLAGVTFATTHNFGLLLLAATVGVLSPSGNEVGPFLAVEQVALAQTTDPARRTSIFAWYNLTGSFATALGALTGGQLVSELQHRGATPLASYQSTLFAYSALGGVLLVLFSRLTARIESPHPETKGILGVREARGVVVRLSALFALDSFAGGFVVQSLLAWWFHLRFGLDPAALGLIFFWANLVAGISSLAAASIARRIGLLNTMVFTHLPSNILLILVPFMPTAPLAIGVLLLRFSISQMDVPTRQSYVMAVVPPHERSAAAGIAGVARTIGASIAPLLATPLIAHAPLAWIPFVIAGGLKIAYDLALLRSLRRVQLLDAR